MNKYPRTVQNAHTTKYVDVKSIEDVWNIILSFPPDAPIYAYAMLLATPYQLLDADAQSVLNRYYYSLQFSTPPYPGSYDDQPAFWVSAVNIIQTEKAQAEKVFYNKK